MNVATSLVSQLFDHIWNKKEIGLIHEIFTPDCPVHVDRDTFTGREKISDFISHWHSAFPDIMHTVDEVIEAEDRIIVRWHGEGTHLGTFLDIPASKHKVHYDGITIFRIDGDRFGEIWLCANMQPIIGTIRS